MKKRTKEDFKRESRWKVGICEWKEKGRISEEKENEKKENLNNEEKKFF